MYLFYFINSFFHLISIEEKGACDASDNLFFNFQNMTFHIWRYTFLDPTQFDHHFAQINKQIKIKSNKNVAYIHEGNQNQKIQTRKIWVARLRGLKIEKGWEEQ
jgi:hypothetical protein